MLIMNDRQAFLKEQEINKLHNHKYPLYALKDNQMYLKVVTAPFHYARSLAEF